MSLELMSAVFRLDLPAQRKLILLALSDFANDDGGACWPSQETLAWKASISTRNLRTNITALESDGWLDIVVPGNGRGRSTVYQLHAGRIRYEAAKADDARKADRDVEKADPDDTKGDARIRRSVSEPPLLDPSSTQGARPQKRIPETLRAELAQEYPNLNEPDQFEAATNHKAYEKARDKAIYYRRWMKRAEGFRIRDEEDRQNRGGSNGNSSRRDTRDPQAFVSDPAGRRNVRVFD